MWKKSKRKWLRWISRYIHDTSYWFTFQQKCFAINNQLCKNQPVDGDQRGRWPDAVLFCCSIFPVLWCVDWYLCLLCTRGSNCMKKGSFSDVDVFQTTFVFGLLCYPYLYRCCTDCESPLSQICDFRCKNKLFSAVTLCCFRRRTRPFGDSKWKQEVKSLTSFPWNPVRWCQYMAFSPCWFFHQKGPHSQQIWCLEGASWTRLLLFLGQFACRDFSFYSSSHPLGIKCLTADIKI